MKRILIFLFLVCFTCLLWAGGESEAAGTDRGASLVEQGKIIPADQIIIDSYISQIDYTYPSPSGNLGVNLYTGYKSRPLAGREEVLHIGIQARRTPFEELPVMNLAFVFDASGSMSGPGKMEYVREGLTAFVNHMRPQDIISIVSVRERPEIILPAVRKSKLDALTDIIEKVHSVLPSGRTNIGAGLAAGYDEVEKHYNPQYVNRVIFISDGIGKEGGAFELAERHKAENIFTTTVGVGADFNLDLMVDISKKGGGSSRFMENTEKARHLFGGDLDRMVVPVASEVEMELVLLEGTMLLNTWGYRNDVNENTIHYSLANLHNRDYETILALVRSPPVNKPGNFRIARFTLSYRDMTGIRRREGPSFFDLTYTDTRSRSSGAVQNTFDDLIVLKSGTILSIAQTLKDIGTVYYSAAAEQAESNMAYGMLWYDQYNTVSSSLDATISDENREIQQIIRAKKQYCLDRSALLHHSITAAHSRLEEPLFEKELGIAEKYIEILGRELGYSKPAIQSLLQ